MNGKIKIIIEVLVVLAVLAIIFYLSFGLDSPEPNLSNRPGTNEEQIEGVYLTYLEAGENCDIPLTESMVTEKTKEIVHYTCSNMANEVKCYVGRDYEIKVKNNIAIVYLIPFSYGIENPFFFSKENGEWKVDLYKMAMGLVMAGSTCDSGWGWRNQELAEEFCDYFEEGQCPDK